VTESPYLSALRRLVQQYDDKQFYNGAQQYAWFEAMRLVGEADAAMAEERAA